MTGMQLTLPLIDHEIKGEMIPQRLVDGYVNATRLCQVAGKRLDNYFTNKETQAFLAELSSITGIPGIELIDARKGGDIRFQGTWVHPYVATNLAQWLSPAFAVQVSIWVTEWISKGGIANRLPYHLRRYMMNHDKVPHTHFSVMNEMAVALVGPLEAKGYQLPERMMPDISMGRMMCDWLRKACGINPDTLPTYPHEFEDGRVVDAKMYPIEHLAAFRKMLYEEWLPKRASKYFKERDATALPFLEKILLSAGMPPQQLK